MLTIRLLATHCAALQHPRDARSGRCNCNSVADKQVFCVVAAAAANLINDKPDLTDDDCDSLCAHKPAHLAQKIQMQMEIYGWKLCIYRSAVANFH